MPSFPGSVKSFTTKNSGDVIQAAHVNDLQDEVNAIEAGYINATAPLNSSRSTVATLSVLGASTFAARPTMPPPDAVRVTFGSTQTISSAASTLAWRSQDYITNSSMHSTGTNPERLTPQSTGLYMINAGVLTSSNSTGYRQLAIFDSSAGVIGRVLHYALTSPAGSDVGIFFQVSGVKRFDVLGGFVTIYFENSAASTLSLLTESWCAMHKL